jgi:hypothetical protein
MPILVRARAAVALGRGELAWLPVAPGDPEARLLVARAALASGGPAALGRVLRGLDASALAASPDLRALSVLVKEGSPAADPVAADPVRAYAEGLRARLDGDTPGAVRWLAAALDGHGDACRAAGEYVAALEALGQPLGDELAPLRAVNRGCVNLTRPAAVRRAVADRGPRLRPARADRLLAHSPVPSSSSLRSSP